MDHRAPSGGIGEMEVVSRRGKWTNEKRAPSPKHDFGLCVLKNICKRPRIGVESI